MRWSCWRMRLLCLNPRGLPDLRRYAGPVVSEPQASAATVDAAAPVEASIAAQAARATADAGPAVAAALEIVAAAVVRAAAADPVL